jgi:hypothetical protein
VSREDTACAAAADLFPRRPCRARQGTRPYKMHRASRLRALPACSAPPSAARSPSRRAAACRRHGAKLATGSSSIRQHGSTAGAN